MRQEQLWRTVAMVACVCMVCVGATPHLDVPECTGAFEFGVAAETAPFRLSSGAAKAPMHRTTARVCFANSTRTGGHGLYVQYTAEDAFVYNPYSECNDDLYEYDVVEIFVAPGIGEPTPKHYVEVEISPAGVLFESHITNPDDTCAGITGDLIPCAASGIVARTAKVAGGWQAAVFIPFATVAPGQPAPVHWAVGMFRVDIVDQAGAQQFIAWSPTDTPEPCFHVPSKFGTLALRP